MQAELHDLVALSKKLIGQIDLIIENPYYLSIEGEFTLPGAFATQFMKPEVL